VLAGDELLRELEAPPVSTLDRPRPRRDLQHHYQHLVADAATRRG
jgi:hypothetical protein